MTHTNSTRGLTYLDYLISCGSQNLLTQSEQTIYLKLYDMTDPDNPKDVTDEATAQVTMPTTDDPLSKTTIDGQTYYVWKLTDDVIDYRIRFSGLEAGRRYGLEAMAYPDKNSEGTVVKGDFTQVVDAGADRSATYQNVTKENPNYQLETQSSVTLSNVRATYINDSYQQKGLEVHFSTNVYEGYKILCKIYETKADGSYSDNDTPVYTYADILGQYTEENNVAFKGEDTADIRTYNYLANTRIYNTGDNTFWIPFPPSTQNKLTGGRNYTVVLQAVTDDEANTNLNAHPEGSTSNAGYEFHTDGIAISRSAAYAITSIGKASVEGDKNKLTITLLANDPNHQIVDDTYSLFIKRIKDGDGVNVSSEKNILGMNATGTLCWMTTETGTNAEPVAAGITLGGDKPGIWTQDIKVKDTEYSQSFTLTGVPSGTYEIYTMAQIDLAADGPDTTTRQILTSFKQTAQTVTDKVMEGRIFASTRLVDGKWKLILRLSGWQNLDKVTSAMCLVVNTDLSYHETFADCTTYLGDTSNPRIELTLNGAQSGDYVVTLNMSTKSGNVEVPVTLNNSDITFSIQ